MNKRNICDVHSEIIKEFNSIIKDVNQHRPDDYADDLFNTLDNIRWQLDNHVTSLVEEALECGQSMENRLKEYRETIEGLGFVRSK